MLSLRLPATTCQSAHLALDPVPSQGPPSPGEGKPPDSHGGPLMGHPHARTLMGPGTTQGIQPLPPPQPSPEPHSPGSSIFYLPEQKSAFTLPSLTGPFSSEL